MNPQPDPIIGNLVATLVLGALVYYTYKAYKFGPVIDIKNFDMVTMGYVEADPRITQITKKVKVVKANTIEESVKDTQLYNDCVDALYSLGVKKSEAKRKALLILNTEKPTPASVQEFLLIAFKYI